MSAVDPRSHELYDAVERRFGLALQPVLRQALFREAEGVVSSGLARSFSEVLARLARGPDDDSVVERLRARVSIGETSFLRDRAQLDALVATVRRELVERHPTKFLRVWSAACATGEEPYSLAILLLRAFPRLRFVVNATDMNPGALDAARAGRYRRSAFRDMDPRELAPHVVPEGSSFVVSPEVRARVRFSQLNLVTDAFPAQGLEIYGFDVVVCRNVLIYVEPRRIPAVMRKIARACAATSLVALTAHEAQAGHQLEGFRGLPRALYLREDARSALTDAAQSGAASERFVPPTPPVPPPPKVSRDPPPVRLVERAREAADAGQLDEAESFIGQHLVLEPESPRAYVVLGLVRQARGDSAGAIEAYRRASFFDRNCAAAELGAVLVLGAAPSPPPEALRHCRRLLRLLERAPDEAPVDPLQMSVAVARRYARQVLERGGEA